MSHQPKVYFTRMRRREEEMELEHLRQNAEFQTKIIDVNNDCLEKIFLYLDFDDFINIAHTNKQLKPAADMAFARKFAKKRLFLQIKFKYRGRSKLTIDETGIKVYDFQTSLRVLRCFGSLFSALFITRPNTSHLQWTDIKIVQYANEFGYESLVTIAFGHMAVGAFENVLQPFSVASIVGFSDCMLDGKLKQLSKWFPRMRALDFRNVDTHLDYIEANSTNLVALNIMGRKQNDSTLRLLNVLRLGTHLIYLRMDFHGWIRSLQDLSKNQIWLGKLHIFCYPVDFLGLGNNIINLPNLIDLHMDYVGFRSQPIPKIPISCQQLHEFSFGLPHRLDHSIIEFFEKHPSIIKLNLVHNFSSVIKNTEDIVHIVRALPSLQEVNFRKIELSVDKVIPFINHANLLKKMGFYMTDRSEFDQLKILLDNEWQLSIDGQLVEVKRKQ